MTSSIRGGFYEATTQRTSNFPIPKATDTQKEYIALLAEGCQTQAEVRYQLQNGIRKNIPSLCPDGQESKLNNKLKSWWKLSFEAFQKEIKKQYKYSMTLEENMQWQGTFENHKQEIQKNSAELAQKEQKLNQAVYQLFGLDADEISLLEESLR